MDEVEYRLTAERRRAVCVHEAGHAVLHALGGAIVDSVAVAPIGATEWHATGRKGGFIDDIWGLCQASSPPLRHLVKWHPETKELTGDRREVAEHLRALPASARPEVFRQLRAQVCAVMAGPAAEQLHLGQEPWPNDEGEDGRWDDANTTRALVWMLPWRGELDYLHRLTVEALRRPDVWGYVLRLADQLEREGSVSDDIDAYLPAPSPRWPASPRTKRPPALVVQPLVDAKP